MLPTNRLTVAVGARQVELAAAVHCAIAVIVGLALKTHRSVVIVTLLCGEFICHRSTHAPRGAGRVGPGGFSRWRAALPVTSIGAGGVPENRRTNAKGMPSSTRQLGVKQPAKCVK